MTKKEDEAFCFGIVVGVVLIAFIGGMLLWGSGAFDNPIDELDLDKDAIATTHILKYYPEYENCSFQYKEFREIECEPRIPGVEVFCDQTEDRDGMNVLGNNPSLTLCFDEITIEEIFQDIVSNYK